MRVEENILLTLSLDHQSYHTEWFTLDLFLYYEMQLTTAIYCLTFFSAPTLSTTIAADLSLVMFILAILFFEES